MKKSNKITLILLGLLALAMPLLSIFVDFGQGSDDAAGTMIEHLAPNYSIAERSFGYEPSEAAEPWLFVLQVLIGLAIFGFALYIYIKKTKKVQAKA